MLNRIGGPLVAAVVGGLVTLTSPAAHADGPALPHNVNVQGNGTAVTLSHSMIAGGVVTLRVSTTNPSTPNGGGSSIVMFKLKGGATLQRVLVDFQEEFGSNPAKGTRDLTRDADFRGLADPTLGRPIVVTERLSAGTYYLLDVAGPPTGPPTVSTLTVKAGEDSGEDTGGLGVSTVTVKAPRVTPS